MKTLPVIKLSGMNADKILNAYKIAANVLLRCETENEVFGKVISAGGCYKDVWTRDASYNTWMAYNLLDDEIAYNSLQVPLYFGKGKTISGKLTETREDQYWDKMLWTIAALDFYYIKKDVEFLNKIYAMSVNTIDEIFNEYFCEEYGLQYGPAFMCDGIGALPNDICNERDCPLGRSNAADYEKANKIMTLSSNCILVGAIRATAKAADLLRMEEASKELNKKADVLSDTINSRLWNEDLGRYDYFVYGFGDKKGTNCTLQESAGHAFSILFDIADDEKINKIMNNIHVEPNGIPLSWPSLENHYIGGCRFKPEANGYDIPQNITIWPNINGLWARACAYKGYSKHFEYELLSLANLICNSEDTVYEIYHAVTGEPGLRFYDKKPDQAWAATAFLNMIYYGMFGLRISNDSVSFNPQKVVGIEQGEISGVFVNNIEYSNKF